MVSGTYQYDANGRLVGITRNALGGLPVSTTLGYDGVGRVSSFDTAVAGGKTYNHHHGYNARHQRVTRTAATGRSWTGMMYNSAGGLTQATLSGGGVKNYSYDARGNRLSGGHAVETWTVNAGLDQASGRVGPAPGSGYGVRGTVTPGAEVKVIHPLAPDGELVAVHPQTGAYEAWWPAFVSGPGAMIQVKVRGTLPGRGFNGAAAVTEKDLWITLPGNVQESFDYDGRGNLVGDGQWTYAWDAQGRLQTATRVCNGGAGSVSGRRSTVG